MVVEFRETVECGEKTCASEVGKFCRYTGSKRFGTVPVCLRFFTDSTKSDFVELEASDGWLQRCQQCLEKGVKL